MGTCRGTTTCAFRDAQGAEVASPMCTPLVGARHVALGLAPRMEERILASDSYRCLSN